MLTVKYPMDWTGPNVERVTEKYWAVLCECEHPAISTAPTEAWYGPYEKYETATAVVANELDRPDSRFVSGHVCKRLTRMAG